MWASNGPLSNLNIGDVLADTGALAVGSLTITVHSWTQDNPVLTLEHRNALNNTTLHSLTFQPNASPGGLVFSFPIVLLLNERVRVIVSDAGSIGYQTQVTLFSL